jgi:hypothetical protein
MLAVSSKIREMLRADYRAIAFLIRSLVLERFRRDARDGAGRLERAGSQLLIHDVSCVRELARVRAVDASIDASCNYDATSREERRPTCESFSRFRRGLTLYQGSLSVALVALLNQRPRKFKTRVNDSLSIERTERVCLRRDA